MIMSESGLALGATLRLARLVIADDLGRWWIRAPAERWAQSNRGPEPEIYGELRPLVTFYRTWDPTWRDKLIRGLDCPYCVGFWIAALVLATRRVPGWRFVTGALTLNEVAAHLGVLLGDFDTEEE